MFTNIAKQIDHIRVTWALEAQCRCQGRIARDLASVSAAVVMLLAAGLLRAQGGPPYYTIDPGTPGNHNREINLGYMPFLYDGLYSNHTPDLDINYGAGNRVQLTLETAWMGVKDGTDRAKYGLGQDQVGVKWRFYESEESEDLRWTQGLRQRVNPLFAAR